MGCCYLPPDTYCSLLLPLPMRLLRPSLSLLRLLPTLLCSASVLSAPCASTLALTWCAEHSAHCAPGAMHVFHEGSIR